jgi:Mrp family chromosome partitioning ATPase/uncharacterized protein involved in exopolysaccharide biosynthesis
MSAKNRMVRLKGPNLDDAAAKRIVARLLSHTQGDIVIDAQAVGAAEPEAIATLASLVRGRADLGLGTTFIASGAMAVELAKAGPVATMGVADAPEKTRERRRASRTPRAETSQGIPHPSPQAGAQPTPTPPDQSTAMPDLGTVFAAVLSRTKTLVAVALAAVAIGAAAGYLFGKSTWETEAVLLYKPADNQLSNDYEVLQNLDAATTFIYRQGSSKDHLAVPSVQIKTLLNTVKIPANLEAVRSSLGLKVPLNTIGAAVEVQVQKDTELMSVKASWKDAATAAALANGIVTTFIEANRRINKENIVDMRDRLASRLKDVSARLETVSEDLASFTELNPIVDLKNQSEQYVQELIRLRASRDEAASRREALKMQIRNLDTTTADLAATVAKEKAAAGSNPSSTEIMARISAINLKLDETKSRRFAMADLIARKADYDRVKQLFAEGLATKAELERVEAERAKALAATENDPETARLLAEIDSLRAVKTTLPETTSPNERLLEELTLKRFEAQLNLVSADSSVQAYDSSAKRVQSSIDAMPSVNKKYARLSTESAGLQAELKGVERMLAQADTALEKGAGDFTVVAKAPLPIYPAKSSRKTLAIGAGVIVLILGWGTLLLIELLDLRIRSGKEAAAALGVRVLASLQRVDRNRLMPGGREDPAHIEAFRILALKLRRMMPRRGSRILVASALAESGKSVVTANLASSWGRSDERVLVIEAETREKARPWPLETFAMEQAAHDGLCDYLSYRAGQLKDIVRPSILPGVDLVGRGSEEALPDLLGSARFSELLEEASKIYSIVMIEAPAVRSYADAIVIGAGCDATLLVLRSRSAPPPVVGKVIDELGRDKLLGIVLTDVEKAFARRDV